MKALVAFKAMFTLFAVLVVDYPGLSEFFKQAILFYEASNEPFGLSAILRIIRMIRKEEAKLHRTHVSNEDVLGPKLTARAQ